MQSYLRKEIITYGFSTGAMFNPPGGNIWLLIFFFLHGKAPDANIANFVQFVKNPEYENSYLDVLLM